MKKALLLFISLAFLGNFAQSQILQNFNKDVTGIEKSSDSGKGLDSLYKTADPSNSANGVLAMHFNFGPVNDTVANLHGRMELGDGKGNATYVAPGLAQNLTFWVYLDSTQKIPDSLEIDTYGMDNTNWDWTENGNANQKKLNVHYALDIPKNVWYPLTFRMAELQTFDKNFAYNASGVGKGFMTGLQIFPWKGNDWTGIIYVDNVGFYGAVPHFIQTFETDINGVEKSSDSGKGLDSLYQTTDPGNSTNHVLAVHLTFAAPNDTVSNLHGRLELGDGKGNATYVTPGAANYLVSWVYLDTLQKIPDSLEIDTYGMDNTNWDWTENGNANQKKLDVHYAVDLPKNVWYPFTFPMAELNALDHNFAYNASGAGKGFMTGLQFFPPSTHDWKGTIYVDNITLLDTIVALPPPVWTAADFESEKNQNFYVASYGGAGTLSVVPDLKTSNGTEVLQAAINLANAPRKFAVVRDSVPFASKAGDSLATLVSFDVYLPNKMPSGMLVKFFLANSSDSVAVLDTVGKQVKANSWNTISLKLDSLKTAGKFDPTKKHRVGVMIYAPQDTSSWKDNVWFDNLLVTGISYPTELPTGVSQFSTVARSYELYNNYPNPFNPTTMIKYDLAEETHVLIQVFDIVGRHVATLVDGKQPAGSYAVPFNASKLASGVYFYRLTAGKFVKTQKMMLLK
ncbi:MAG TPA: T9SS type A sorting domain-containing protein [Bacteroidota bacterium]|nr:T9SS type A sorting domain-containing protein [Bacteroidota bacterium]